MNQESRAGEEMAALLPAIIHAISAAIRDSAEEVTALDQAIGDGDHVFNLQRGIEALLPHTEEWSQLDWSSSLMKVGMTVMSTIGGASGSLFGTLLIALGKALQGRPMDLSSLAPAFGKAVDAVKARGKAGLGDKTMLDVLIPVAATLQQAAVASLPRDQALAQVRKTAKAGAESTRDLIAAKGRASFLGEKARGHLDPGAKTSQLMIQAITEVLGTELG